MRLIFSSLLCLYAIAQAGDKATFINLGWSPDNAYFAFAQYGEQDGSGFPYAELYVVDVGRNDFAPGGAIKTLWKEDADPQVTGLHVLLEVRADAETLLRTYNIQTQIQNELLIPPAEAERETVSWQDSLGNAIIVQLEQKSQGNPEMLESKAAFQLKIDGAQKSPLIIGNLERFRPYVLRYDIDRVLCSPDKKFLVFVIRMTKIGFEGPDIRFMVETAVLP